MRGTERYATHVRAHPSDHKGDTLTSECSCPVGLRCKHAIVVLTYLDVLKKVRDNLVTAGRRDEWTAYEAELRVKHSRKIRFLEVLNGLTGRKIVDE